MKDTLPGRDGCAGPLQGPWIRRPFSREEMQDVRAVFFTTCQQCRDLSPPRGLFCIKHWSSFLKFSYFRTLLCSCMFSQFASLQDSRNLLDRNSRRGHHTITLREVLGGYCTLRQLDFVYKNYGHVSFPWDTHVNKKHTKLNLFVGLHTLWDTNNSRSDQL